jgi:serine/threonine-protein kinase
MGSAREDTEAPTAVGSYRLLAEVGRDALGVLYLACPAGAHEFPKWAVVRRVHAGVARDAALVHAFLAATRVALRIVHRNVAATFDFGPRDVPPWVAREHLLGEIMLDVIALATGPQTAAPMPWDLACWVVAEAADGLAAIRGRIPLEGPPMGFITGTGAPNVVLSYAGDVKIVDGCLPLIEGRAVVDSATLSYLPPDSAEGGREAPQVFSLGVILWELVAGRRLFLGATDDETLRLVDARVVPLLRNLVPAAGDLDEVVRRAVGKSPRDAFSGVAALGAVLRETLATLPRPTPRDDLGKWMRSSFAAHLAQKKAELDDAWAVERAIQERGDPLPEERSSDGDTTVTLDSTTRDDTGVTVIAVRDRGRRGPSGEGSFDDIPTIPRATRPGITDSAPSWRVGPPPTEAGEPLRAEEAPSGEVTVVRDLSGPLVPSSLRVAVATPQINYLPGYGAESETLTPEAPVELPTTVLWSPPPPAAAEAEPEAAPASAPSTPDAPTAVAPPRGVTLPPVEHPYHPPIAQWPVVQSPVPPRPAGPPASLLAPPGGERRSLILVAMIGFVVALGVVVLVAASRRSGPEDRPPLPTATAISPTPPIPAPRPPPSPARPPTAGWQPALPTSVPVASPDELPRATPSPRTTPAPPPFSPPSVGPARTGLLTVFCTPACDRVLDGNRSLGPSPVFKVPVAVGVHRLRLRVDSPSAEKTVTVSVSENDVTVVRENVVP